MTKLASTTDSIAELTTVIADNGFHGKRRMYACAALKLLATDPKMRSKLIRTQSVLSALLHVIYGKHSISQECTVASEALVSLLSDMQIYGTTCNKNCATPCDMPDAQELGSYLLTFVHKNRHIFRDYGLENDDVFYKGNNANAIAERNSTLKSMKYCLDQVSSSREAAAVLSRSPLLLALTFVASKSDDDAQTICAKICAHLTRDRNNTYHLIFHVDGFLNALARASASTDRECRKYAFFAIQNISFDENCAPAIVSSSKLIDNVCQQCMDCEECYEIQIACMVTLRNVCRSASNIEKMFNKPFFIDSLFAVLKLKDLHKEKPYLLNTAKSILDEILKLFKFCAHQNNVSIDNSEAAIQYLSDLYNNNEPKQQRRAVCWNVYEL